MKISTRDTKHKFKYKPTHTTSYPYYYDHEALINLLKFTYKTQTTQVKPLYISTKQRTKGNQSIKASIPSSISPSNDPPPPHSKPSHLNNLNLQL